MFERGVSRKTIRPPLGSLVQSGLCRPDSTQTSLARRQMVSRRGGHHRWRETRALARRRSSWVVMRRVPLATVKAVLRHSSIVVTERYGHLAPESARGALTLLDEPGVRPASVDARFRHAGSAASEKEQGK